jgi:hypothetical protein
MIGQNCSRQKTACTKNSLSKLEPYEIYLSPALRGTKFTFSSSRNVMMLLI